AGWRQFGWVMSAKTFAPLEFETLLRNDKNIFFVAFIQKKAPRQSAWCFLLAGALTLRNVATQREALWS
ncbi:MAG: hypothetical protein IJX62_03655, partial [Clostridia bacterium]|nr:hypothetical protein [Clostridia bacterium]